MRWNGADISTRAGNKLDPFCMAVLKSDLAEKWTMIAKRPDPIVAIVSKEQESLLKFTSYNAKSRKP